MKYLKFALLTLDKVIGILIEHIRIFFWRIVMAGASKNSRTTVATQKFECPECGGEIVMKTLYENGRLRNVAECSKCKLTKRRPKDFRK